MSGGILRRIVSPLYSSSSRHLLRRSQSNPNFQLHPVSSTQSSSNLRFFRSSEDTNKQVPIDLKTRLKSLFGGKCYANEEFDKMVEDYRNGNKQMLRPLLDAIIARKVCGKHDNAAHEEIYEEIKKEIKDREINLEGKEFYYCPLRDRIIIEQAQEISQAKRENIARIISRISQRVLLNKPSN